MTKDGERKSNIVAAIPSGSTVSAPRTMIQHVATECGIAVLSGKSLRRFRRGIGMVFQSFNLVTRTSVIQNVLAACVPDMPFWRVLLGAFRKADKIKALESLDKVGILDKAYMRADQLSGGQQQRASATTIRMTIGARLRFSFTTVPSESV